MVWSFFEGRKLTKGTFIDYRWEKDQFFKAAKYQSELQDKQRPDAGMKPNTEEREAYAEEAKKLLDGSKSWRPTWQALGLSYDRKGLGKRATSS
jgi:large subunit ribosomal protein L23